MLSNNQKSSKTDTNIDIHKAQRSVLIALTQSRLNSATESLSVEEELFQEATTTRNAAVPGAKEQWDPAKNNGGTRAQSMVGDTHPQELYTRNQSSSAAWANAKRRKTRVRNQVGETRLNRCVSDAETWNRKQDPKEPSQSPGSNSPNWREQSETLNDAAIGTAKLNSRQRRSWHRQQEFLRARSASVDSLESVIIYESPLTTSILRAESVSDFDSNEVVEEESEFILDIGAVASVRHKYDGNSSFLELTPALSTQAANGMSLAQAAALNNLKQGETARMTAEEATNISSTVATRVERTPVVSTDIGGRRNYRARAAGLRIFIVDAYEPTQSVLRLRLPKKRSVVIDNEASTYRSVANKRRQLQNVCSLLQKVVAEAECIIAKASFEQGVASATLAKHYLTV